MSKLLFTGALAVTAALAAHPAVHAGEHRIRRVSITEADGAYTASGNLADVHNSQGNVEAISCWIRGTANDYVDALCFARDEKGRTFQCYTFEESKLRAIAAISDDSTVTFGTFRDGSNCGFITVTKGSYTAARRPPTPQADPSGVLDVTGIEVVQ
jgi:hypothetical protein